MKNPKQWAHAAWGLGLLLCSGPAFAENMDGIQFLIYGVVLFVFAPVFTAAFLLTLRMPWRWLKLLIRCLVVAAFWAPINLGGPVWPASCFWLAQPPAIAEAAVSIAVTTAIIWVICLGISSAKEVAGGDAA